MDGAVQGDDAGAGSSAQLRRGRGWDVGRGGDTVRAHPHLAEAFLTPRGLGQAGPGASTHETESVPVRSPAGNRAPLDVPTRRTGASPLRDRVLQSSLDVSTC